MILWHTKNLRELPPLLTRTFNYAPLDPANNGWVDFNAGGQIFL
jgi:hypothetical protein